MPACWLTSENVPSPLLRYSECLPVGTIQFPDKLHAAVTAERGVLGALGGGCQVPIGAHATVDGGTLRVLAIVASPDGAEMVRGEAAGPVVEAERIGRKLGAELLDRGARRILEVVYSA